MKGVDLNADLGEGMGDDEALLDLVSSANIACGGHAGDTGTMARTLRAAAARGVAAGAHPSFEDREHFGRRELDLPPATVREQVLRQLEAIAAVARRESISLRHVKAHGALYNRAAREPALAHAVAAAVREFDPGLAFYALAGSALARASREAGLFTVEEAFADRAYRADATLLPRSEPGAVLHDAAAVAARALGMAQEGRVRAVDGTTVRLSAGTICVHGDTPGAVAMARAVRTALEGAGVVIGAPAAG
ncbi:MAG: LamB/YcsF family protein [Betaproteobacteria bacterium]